MPTQTHVMWCPLPQVRDLLRAPRRAGAAAPPPEPAAAAAPTSKLSRAAEVLEAVKTGKPVAAKESAPAAAGMAAD